ncbi:sushi: von Willebrand factor type A: EGF and pentraxin domain-containing protein 1-like protein, partial [Leptotrombidium deliense]
VAEIAALCGFPGKPAFARVLEPNSAKRVFEEGQTVSFACDHGFYMKGKATRKCLPSGVWSNEIAVCDTTLSDLGKATSRESLSLYPPEAAIDSDVQTCFYSDRQKPRFWRLQLRATHRVIAVSLTIPFASNIQHIFHLKHTSSE